MHTTTLLTGAGSVENGWAPVLAALDLAKGQESLANFIFSMLIYQQRFTARNLTESDKQVTSQALSRVKKNIASQFYEAENLKVRPYFSKIYKEHIQDQTDWVIPITTNWDLELEKALYEYGYTGEVIHLHGSIESSENLYLPTEAMNETYWTSDQNRVSQNEHARTVELLMKSDDLIIYGLSISELDPELAMLLGATISNFKRVKIIDPQPHAVKNRLKFLINCGDSTISGNPEIITEVPGYS